MKLLNSGKLLCYRVDLLKIFKNILSSKLFINGLTILIPMEDILLKINQVR